jgi:hypothetical protein
MMNDFSGLKGKPILCLDFDGVIHSYSSGWKGPRCIPDMPVNGALQFICEAMEYFTVDIYSSRSRYVGGKKAMKKWLWDRYAEIGGVYRRSWSLGPFKVRMDIPEIPQWWYDYILCDTSMEPWEHEVNYGILNILKKIKFPTRKPPAFLQIDDRGFCFNGEFPNPKELLKFKPWNKK